VDRLQMGLLRSRSEQDIIIYMLLGSYAPFCHSVSDGALLRLMHLCIQAGITVSGITNRGCSRNG
jgi:predicted membrane channel-forming protein YqfA (hemolysin III family)